ncbi:MAG: hypothetical protein CL573_06380 [Alphaproteobacteria bacterium]|nr:hypothetical protein [Alphaproteobacteria bacterium]
MVRLNPRSLRVLNQDDASDMMRSVEGADHVGAFLREARETAGRTVADVAQNLRIRRIYLEAIEDGRFDELPGAIYAVGFVRSYAAYLNLDVPQLVARFKEEAVGIQVKQELEFPTSVPEGRFPGGLIISVCLLLAGAAFGGWYWYENQNSVEVTRVPKPPSYVATTDPDMSPAIADLDSAAVAPKLQRMDPASVTETSGDGEAESGAGNAAVQDAAPSVIELQAPTVSASREQVAMVPRSESAFSSEPAIVALPEVEAAAPLISSDLRGRTFGARNSTARIVLWARENTWVQVHASDQSVVITQMLEAGDRYMVPNLDGLRLMTGNAGGLEILVDDETVPAIGTLGQSRRNVRLEPDLLRAGSAVVQ